VSAMKSRPPIERMALISRLMRAREPFNASSLALRFEVTSKTNQRVIEFMKDRLGFKFHYVAAQRGFIGCVPKRRVS